MTSEEILNELLQTTRGMKEDIKEIAKIRIENPHASLVELGQMLKNPIGKSGVNHRLNKIIEIVKNTCY